VRWKRWSRQGMGVKYLRNRLAQPELARTNRELKQLKSQIAVLEERKSKLIAGSK
jgi:hypothetical protein